MATIRSETVSTARDNVIFELGLLAGRLGIERCFLIVPKGPEEVHLPTDLAGITPATFAADRQDGNMSAALGLACNRVRMAMQKYGRVSYKEKLSGASPEQAKEARLSKIEPVLPVYSAWRHVEKFDLFEASHLWLGREPKRSSRNSDAEAWENALAAAIRTGKLCFIPKRLKPGPYSMHDTTDQQRDWDKKRQHANPDSFTEVSREQLKRFANESGEKPKFLDD